jgi:zinc protease
MVLATRFRAGVLFLACLFPTVLLAQQSDVKPDPAITFGSLKNGMRYQLQRNGTPAGQVAIRLRIQAGSLYENEDERGIAHLLEHMAFRGSKKLADGDAWKELQRLGLKAGADANALTSIGTTIYQLDLPTNDAYSLDKAMTLLREIASELTLSAAALDSERSIVLSEARVRAAPLTRLAEEAQRFNFEGRRMADRWPLGKPEVIASATPQMLRRFYNAWYRPERTVLVVVGAIDVRTFERDIEKHFGSWKGSGEPGVEPDLGTAANRSAATHVFSEEGAPSAVAINWILPARAGPETRAGDREASVRDIGLLTLTRRLQPLANGPNPPFRGAGVNRASAAGSREYVVSVGAEYMGDDWRKALVAIETTRRAALEHGISQAEVDQTVRLVLQSAQQLADRAATRSSVEIASNQLRDLDQGGVPESPAQQLEDVRAQVAGLTAAEVTAALKKAFSGAGPLVLLSTTSVTTDEVLAREFQSAQSLPLQAQSTPGKPIWPYTSFGTPGTVADRQVVKDLDVTLIRFANGVRLNIKPTKFQANQVTVYASIGDGRLELPKDRPSAMWAGLAGSFVGGGVAGIDLPQMQRALDGKVYKVDFVLGDASFVLIGNTRPADLDTQLQVLAAYVKAPAFRPQAFEFARRNMLAQIRQAGAAAPLGVFGVQIGGLLHSGDPRWTFPVAADVEATKPEDLRALLGNTLAFGPIEVTVVGDVDVESVVQAVGATFGALPRRSSQTLAATAADSRFPEGGKEPAVINHQGRDDQGVAAVAWPTTDLFSHPQVVSAIGLMCDIVQIRLTEQLRIAAGETYSAECASRPSPLLPGYGFVMASADIQPAHAQVFYDTVSKIAQDLRANPPSADEMQRVQKVAVEKYKQAMQTNPFWLNMLVRVQRDPQRLDVVRKSLAELEAVKPADVQRAATTYLLDKTAYKVVVRKGTTTAAAPASR